MRDPMINELIVMQAEMVTMEGMLEALIKGAYNGTRIEYIANSLEILLEYMGRRSEKLDMIINEPMEVVFVDEESTQLRT